MTERTASVQHRNTKSIVRHRHALAGASLLGALVVVAASCLLPPPGSQTPEPCDFRGCGANEIRICQDQCVVPRQVGESCDPYVFCDEGTIEVCASGLTCANRPEPLAGQRFKFECVQAKPIGASCFLDPLPICPATDPCPSGQYCRDRSRRQYSVDPRLIYHGPSHNHSHADPKLVYVHPPADPRTLSVFGGVCTDLPTQGQLCGTGGCSECEPGLECLGGVCRRACATSDDCPCQSNERLCCGGYCRSLGSTWLALRSAIFDDYHCAQCHGGSNPEAGLNLEPPSAYADTVSVASSIDSGWLRIKPGAPNDSVLYRLLDAKTAGSAPPPPWPSGMPLGSAAKVSPKLTNALRLWILAGAKQNGVVAGTEDILGACAPLTATPTPTTTATSQVPIPTPTWTPVCAPPPATGTGTRLYAPPWRLGASAEREVCFATYHDLEQGPLPAPTEAQKACPTPANLPQGPTDCVRFDESHFLQTPNFSHHSIVRSYIGTAAATDPGWGIWSCLGGPTEGKSCAPGAGTGQCGDRGACVGAIWACSNGAACDPRNPGVPAPAGADCGSAGPCQIAETPSCNGFGPIDIHYRTEIIGGAQGSTADQVYPGKVYSMIPLKGIIVWNSHAKNIDPAPVRIEQCFDLGFADAQDVYPLKALLDFNGTFKVMVPPFESREYCRAYTFPQNAHVVQLDSHMHKRGQRFRIWGPPNTACGAAGGCEATPPSNAGATPTPILENLKYDEPTPVAPGYCLDSAAPSARTVLYCAEYYNGPTAQADVKRASTSPNSCAPTKCVSGPTAMSCITDADCMNVPGACDACTVTGGLTTDDEMFILLGSYYEAPCP